MLSWPNRITVVRLLLVTPFILLLLNASLSPWYRYGALGLAILIGIGDAIDGIVARRTGKVTRIGTVLDPVADKALMISALVCLATKGFNPDPALQLHWMVAIVLVSREVFMVIGAVVVFILAGMFQALPSFAGKATTVMQFVTIALTITLPDLVEWLPRQPVLITTWCIWGVTVLLAVISWLGYIRMGSKLVASVGNTH
jgi:cardiolipin synthase